MLRVQSTCIVLIFSYQLINSKRAIESQDPQSMKQRGGHPMLQRRSYAPVYR